MTDSKEANLKEEKEKNADLWKKDNNRNSIKKKSSHKQSPGPVVDLDPFPIEDGRLRERGDWLG